jgi:hypothetical protein
MRLLGECESLAEERCVGSVACAHRAAA